MYFGKYWLILRFGKNFNVGLFHRVWSLKLHWALQFEYLGQFLFIYSSLASILLIKCEYVHDYNALRNFNLHYEGNNWCVSFLFKDHNVGTFSYAKYSEWCTVIICVGFNYTFMLVLLTLSIFKAKRRSVWFLKIIFLQFWILVNWTFVLVKPSLWVLLATSSLWMHLWSASGAVVCNRWSPRYVLFYLFNF